MRRFQLFNGNDAATSQIIFFHALHCQGWVSRRNGRIRGTSAPPADLVAITYFLSI
jgi:hypothetical protein